jgi:chondroitin 4-sulfotransferase 11
LGLENVQQRLPYIKLDKKILNKFNIGYGRQHVTPDDYSDDIKNNYYSFTFVRNPYERFLSTYFYTIKHLKMNLSFNDFAKNFDGFIEKYHENLSVTYAKQCDFIGRFETLQQDFDTVCHEIGIPKMKLPHTNKSKHKHYTEYYDDETKQIVAKRYAKDIEYFGYEFGE